MRNVKTPHRSSKETLPAENSDAPSAGYRRIPRMVGNLDLSVLADSRRDDRSLFAYLYPPIALPVHSGIVRLYRISAGKNRNRIAAVIRLRQCHQFQRRSILLARQRLGKQAFTRPSGRSANPCTGASASVSALNKPVKERGSAIIPSIYMPASATSVNKIMIATNSATPRAL